MNVRAISRMHAGEYACVLRTAAEEGWLVPLLAAHLTPISQGTAQDIVVRHCRLQPTFGNRGGQARYPGRKRSKYGMGLPSSPGVGGGWLRVGIVIHEIAHVVVHRAGNNDNHGPKFCATLRRLLKKAPSPERTGMKEIYSKHAGPFSIVLTRQFPNSQKQFTDLVKGPLTGPQAHEQARQLVMAPDGDVVGAFVYSDQEGKFVGAIYQRGHDYEPWQEGVDVALEQPEGALLPTGRDEPVSEMVDSFDVSLPAAQAGNPRPRVRRVRKTTGVRFVADPEGQWPPSKPAQHVRTTCLERGPMTSVEIVDACAPGVQALGVAHPASLVSRLKQAGLLKEYSA